MRHILNPILVYGGAPSAAADSRKIWEEMSCHSLPTHRRPLITTCRHPPSNPPTYRVTRAAFRGSPTGRRSTRNFEPCKRSPSSAALARATCCSSVDLLTGRLTQIAHSEFQSTLVAACAPCHFKIPFRCTTLGAYASTSVSPFRISCS